MNRRDMLKLLGVAATTTVLPLSFSDDYPALRLRSAPVPQGMYWISHFYANGEGKKSKVGKVGIYRKGTWRNPEPKLIIRAQLNVCGGCLHWQAPAECAIGVINNDILFEIDSEINFGTYLMDDDRINRHGLAVMMLAKNRRFTTKRLNKEP